MNILLDSHLLVCWAILTFSEENCSSRSNRSNFGGSSSRNCGGNTAGCNGGKGVSNWGVIRVRDSCLTFSCSKALQNKYTTFSHNFKEIKGHYWWAEDCVRFSKIFLTPLNNYQLRFLLGHLQYWCYSSGSTTTYLIAFGTRLVSSLNRELSNSMVMSRGTSSLSWRQVLSWPASLAMSGSML